MLVNFTLTNRSDLSALLCRVLRHKHNAQTVLKGARILSEACAVEIQKI